MPTVKKHDREKFYPARGFALGTAILTATDLKQMYDLVARVVNSLSDPTVAVLRDRVRARLEAAQIDINSHTPVRSFANRSIINPKNVESDTLAHGNQLEKLEAIISNRKAIILHKQHGGAFRKKSLESIGDFKEVWPLQILFHNIAWYLAYESRGPNSSGLLTVARLDRLKLVRELPHTRDVDKMQLALQRMEVLCRRCGGIFFTDNLNQQKDVLRDLDARHARIDAGQQRSPMDRTELPSLSSRDLEGLIKRGSMTLVRFRCTAKVFRFMREGFNRYPPEQMRLSGPRPGDPWTLPDLGIEQLEHSLDPNETRPYPVEFILPSWTIGTNDFQGWLFGFGGEVEIEAPESLRDEHRKFGVGIAALYPASATEGSVAAEHGSSSTSEDKTPPC
jgi:hypothetical protein